jgi:hypothetical protein
MSNKETPLTKEEAIASAAKLAGVSEELIYAITEQKVPKESVATPAVEGKLGQAIKNLTDWHRNGCPPTPPVEISKTHEFSNSTHYVPPMFRQPLDIYDIIHRSRTVTDLMAKMKEAGEKIIETTRNVKWKHKPFVYRKPSWEYFGRVGKIAAAMVCKATPEVTPVDEATKKFMADWLALGDKPSHDSLDYTTDLVFQRIGKMHVHKAGQKSGGKMRHKKKKLYSITGNKVVALYRYSGCYPTSVGEAKELPDGNVELTVTFDTESTTKPE